MKRGYQQLKTMLLVFLVTTTVTYADTPSINCSVEAYKGTAFKDLYLSTKSTASQFCQSLIATRINQSSLDLAAINASTRQVLSAFADTAKRALDDKNLSTAADYDAQFKAVKTTFTGFDFTDPRLPEFKVKKKLTGNKTEGYFVPLKDSPDRFVINEVDQCPSVTSGMSCKAVFRDFADAFNPYRSAYNTVYDNAKHLDTLGRDWDRFLDISKSQTALEVWLTTLFHRKHFQKNHLVGPPSSQIIALHPHLIYSDMNDAPDGSKQELGLAVEWIGINFWDWKIPFGFSYTTTYVDRAGFDNKGKGIMLHINNHYSIGWSEHGDEDTVYVTIDLLKLFEEKKQQYQSYLSKYYQ